jgi:hypothetical protein
MRKIVTVATLLAAFAMPALAEDAVIKKDDASQSTKIDQTTTASTPKKKIEMAPTASGVNIYGGCMHRNNTAANMM